MQIFATDPDPIKAARWLDNKRLVKMCVESCQILSTAVYLNDGEPWYKPTHVNHPVVKWTARNIQNFYWLTRNWWECLRIYRQKYNRNHKSSNHLIDALSALYYEPKLPMKKRRSPFCNCTPYKDMNTIAAYRKYLTEKQRKKNEKTI